MRLNSRRFAAASAGLAVVAELALGCASGRSTTAAPPAPAPAPAAQIYAAVIGKHFQPKPGRQLYIVSTLRPPPDWIGHLDHPLWPALMEASSRAMSVPVALPVPLPYAVLSEGELEAARRDRTPQDGFLPGHPDADELVSFSAIGFDPNGKSALVYVEWHCGGECGGGGYYELERQGEFWRTVDYFHRFSS